MKTPTVLPLRSAFILLLLGLTVAACDTVDAPVADVESGADVAVASKQGATSDGCVFLTESLYKVCYEGRDYDAGKDQTTFSYTAYATGTGISSSDNFFLEIPEGLPNPIVTSPKNPVEFVSLTYDGGTVYGTEWGNSVSRQGRSYSYTFEDNIGEGQVVTIIEGSGYTTYGSVTGPARPGFKIEGTVFNDTDGEGAVDPLPAGYGVYEPDSEATLGGVHLALLNQDGSAVQDALGNPVTDTTDASGYYVFEGLPAGTYTVAVPLSNLLYESYNSQPIYVFTSGAAEADGTASRSASLGPDATLDFGFWVDGSLLAEALRDPNSDYAPELTDDNYYWAPILNGLFDDQNSGTEDYKYAYEIMLNGYAVSFRGLSVGDGETTYHYRVRDLGATPEVSHFTLEYDAVDDTLTCAAPIRTDPAAEIGPDPTTGLDYAVKWDGKIPSGSYKDFSVTFAGTDLRPGAIKGALKNGTNVDIDFLPGPCARSVASRTDLMTAVNQIILPASGTSSTGTYQFLSAFDGLFQVQPDENLQGAVHRLVTPLPNPLPDAATELFDDPTLFSLTVSKQVKLLLGLSTPKKSLADRAFLDIEAFLASKASASKLSGTTTMALGGDGGTTDRQLSLSSL